MKISRIDKILKYIVEDFIETGVPVGSESLLSRHDLACSSATVRNAMAYLEDAGYLEKTHTSSGRVPSNKGYSYYIERLQNISEEDEDGNNSSLSLVRQFEDMFRLVLSNKTKSIEKLMDESCKILSELTNLTTMLLGPKAIDEKLTSLQIVKLSDRTVTALLVTDKGSVQNKSFVLNEKFTVENIQKCALLLNERLVGTPIYQIEDKINLISPMLTDKLKDEMGIVLTAIKEALINFAKERLTSYGRDKLLEIPEFAQNKDDFKDLFKSEFNTHDYDSNLDYHVAKDGFEVNLFTNSDSKESELAVISKTLSLPGQKGSKIAVVGPRRMNYVKIMKALVALDKIMNEYFENSLKGGDDEE